MEYVKHKNISIGIGFVITGTSIFITFFIILCYQVYVQIREEHIALALTNGQRALFAVSDHVSRLLDDSDSYVRSVRHHYVEHGDVADMPLYLQDIKVNNADSFLGNLSIANSSGHFIFNSGNVIYEHFDSTGLAYFEYFKNYPQDSVYIDPSRLGKLTGKLQFRLVRPILKNGSFDGYVQQPLRPEHFTTLFNAFDLGPHSFTAMFTLDHRLIARQPSVPEETYGVPQDKIDLWSHLAKADSGQYVTRSPIDGIERYILYNKIHDYPVVIDIGLARDDIDESLHDIRLYIISQAVSVCTASLIFCILTLLILRKNSQLILAGRTIRALANTDSLTGAKNHRYFFETAEVEFARAVRYDLPLAVIMIDADHFKSINDNYGHAIGDQVLCQLVKSTAEVLRETDILGRIGGEEFAILMPQTPLAGAEALAERVRERIGKSEIAIDGRTVHLTVSIGVSARLSQTDSFRSMLQEADEALYRAKKAGRDRVALAVCATGARDKYR
ncbi:diguanylate cyclase [Telmatospirillum sp.]|uniref:sensor domain-containing diguanylate cyclase n=1 Tax=Telmatospirillum sp. TaxID=2079197 RepID=UPI00284A2A98|nr:diguanylate cyclase [Telmatospirillum sp.]MDR3435648.1 diguanylate cyclase [Telmatospirillum sp.]